MILCSMNQLLAVSCNDSPWYADIVNFLACGVEPHGLNSNQRKKLFHDVKYYFWDDPFLYRSCVDLVICRCVPSKETESILSHCHDLPYGGHAGTGFPNRNTRAEISAQIFRLGICTFSESENSPFPNRKTLFSESENEPLIWGFASEKSLFRVQAFFRTQTFPNRKSVFSESEKAVFRIQIGFRLFKPKLLKIYFSNPTLSLLSKLFKSQSFLCPEALKISVIRKPVFLSQANRTRRSVFVREMSKEILGIGSETRPPVLVMGEYQQWRRRMIHFLDLLDENLMKSIREGPIRPTVTVAAVPKTDTCPELPAYVVEKPVEMFNPEQRARHLIDKRALTLLIMALPNDSTREWTV
ncbi:hypothetical protein OSB04_011066 [Centaurea solstitialis]|uniref:Uncharacterized protein n=1 Tax=Centaurea solstitialis TaxID=347529 RepID=A0AA38TRT4_9ASTR|nr:hypothetical protein OSB04_011066 [Centaurea solstitialis]